MTNETLSEILVNAMENGNETREARVEPRRMIRTLTYYYPEGERYKGKMRFIPSGWMKVMLDRELEDQVWYVEDIDGNLHKANASYDDEGEPQAVIHLDDNDIDAMRGL